MITPVLTKSYYPISSTLSPVKVRVVAVDDGRSSVITAGRMIGWAEDAFRVIGLKVSVVREKGDPRRVLIDQAIAWDADSIFVGGRRFGSALERFQLGSTATALVTKAHCSVEIARPAINNKSIGGDD